MGKGGGERIFDVEKEIEYRANYNPAPIKRMLGLDGSQPMTTLPIFEKIRLGQMLQRADYLSSEEVIALRQQIPVEENPFEKKHCSEHGVWYHDAFGCMHHDHTDPHHTDLPPIDRVCKAG
jgi:hypothetical protein